MRASARSVPRKRLVQATAPETFGRVASVQTAMTVRKATATQGRSYLSRPKTASRIA